MANHLDLPRAEADEVIVLPKTVPSAEFKMIASTSGHEKWELSAGVLSGKGEYRRALTVQLICHQSLRPFRQSYRFSLFRMEYGQWKRAYQLDTTSVPLVEEGDHDWPHEHIGTDRINFTAIYPVNFSDAVAYFCKTTNTTFEDRLESPFEFKLK